MDCLKISQVLFCGLRLQVQTRAKISLLTDTSVNLFFNFRVCRQVLQQNSFFREYVNPATNVYAKIKIECPYPELSNSQICSCLITDTNVPTILSPCTQRDNSLQIMKKIVIFL